MIKELLQVYDRHIHKIRNAMTVNLYVSCLFLKPCSMTFRTDRFSSVTCHHYTVLDFILVITNHIKETVNTDSFFFRIFTVRWKSMPQPLLLFVREFVIGFEYREIVICCSSAKFIFPYLHFISMPTNYTIFINA